MFQLDEYPAGWYLVEIHQQDIRPSEVTYEIVCSTHFDVDHFVNQDEDLGGYRPVDFSDLLSANVFSENGNDRGPD